MKTFVQFINEIRLSNPMIAHLVQILKYGQKGGEDGPHLNQWLDANSRLRWGDDINLAEMMAEVKGITSAIPNSLIRQDIERAAKRVLESLVFRVKKIKRELEMA